MNPQLKLLRPLVEQLELLTQVVNQSPYISRDERVQIEREIQDLSEQLKDGDISFPQVEKSLSALNKKAAVGEITSLTSKIYYLNPSSPRLESLRALEKQLREDEISPEQARKSLQDLMQG